MSFSFSEVKEAPFIYLERRRGQKERREDSNIKQVARVCRTSAVIALVGDDTLR